MVLCKGWVHRVRSDQPPVQASAQTAADAVGQTDPEHVLLAGCDRRRQPPVERGAAHLI